MSKRIFPVCVALALIAACAGAACAQMSERALEEAARQTGLSKEELLRRYADQTGGEESAVEETTEPGLRALPEREALYELPALGDGAAAADSEAVASAPEPPPLDGEAPRYFGADFFRLERDPFEPTLFGPVPETYLIGVGDQIAVDVWGDVEFRIERIVDRDGSIILPRGGKIDCHNRTLAEVERAVREKLAASYSGIAADGEGGSTFVDVGLGRLRAIRVYVVGDVARPGAYDLGSLSTIFTALYAAGGPRADGSMRDIRLVRGDETVASLDIYDYLLHGRKPGDRILRDGDTVLVPGRGRTVSIKGAVRRPLLFELKPGEDLEDLIAFAGGFEVDAAAEMLHLERLLPQAERRPGRPDRIHVDITLDGGSRELLDGDAILVDRISERLESWVEVLGNVKRPGRYAFRPGMTAVDLLEGAGGVWGDTLEDLAIVFRTSDALEYSTIDFNLGDVLSGARPAPALRAMDKLHVFSRWSVEDRHMVTITGAVREPGEFPYREGMSLRDLILLASGLEEGANLMRAEVSRLTVEAMSQATGDRRPSSVVVAITVELGDDWLAASEDFALKPRDEVAIRRLPWWEDQRRVTLKGEFMYPGVYSLVRPDETLSELVGRAGGLKPTADVDGARIVRSLDEVGNIALDLSEALEKPGSKSDIPLAPGDVVNIPAVRKTVKVTGVVGFPTSVIYEPGKGLGYYVDRAGGYAEGADKWRTVVVYPSGMSRPINRFGGDPEVLAGSTIVVPLKQEEKGDSKLETLKEISAILASLATVWLVIDRTK